jgi:hypothetical protein
MDKPLIIDNFDTASLSELMRCYGSFIRQNPRAWLAGLIFSPDEVAAFPELIGQVRINKAQRLSVATASQIHAISMSEQNHARIDDLLTVAKAAPQFPTFPTLPEPMKDKQMSFGETLEGNRAN